MIPPKYAMERRKSVRPPLLCSCRLVLSVLSCLGVMCMYTLRVNIIVALDCMVEQNAEANIARDRALYMNKSFQAPQCGDDANRVSAEAISFDVNISAALGGQQKDYMKWGPAVQGALKESFFWGYWTTQIPGGWLSERYGGKRLFGWAIFGSGVLTLLVPLAAIKNYAAVIIIRILIGVLQGTTWPAMHVIWSRWAPPSERQKLNSLCYSGSTLGILITVPFMTLMCELDADHGWMYAMYITGAICIIWFFVWDNYVFDSPELHPRISSVERFYICISLRKFVTMSMTETHTTPWKAIMSSSAMWAFMTSHMVATALMYTNMTYLTLYFKDILYYDLTEDTAYLVVLSTVIFISWNVSGAVYDKFTYRKATCTPTNARKIGNTIGALLPGLLYIIVSFLDCTQDKLVMMLLITINTLSGVQYGCGYFNSVSEMAPQHTGVLYGISNTLTTFFVIVLLRLTNALISNKSKQAWQIEFLVMSAVSITGSIIFIAYGSAEVQRWAVVPDVRIRSDSKPRVTMLEVQDPEIKESEVPADIQEEKPSS